MSAESVCPGIFFSPFAKICHFGLDPHCLPSPMQVKVQSTTPSFLSASLELPLSAESNASVGKGSGSILELSPTFSPQSHRADTRKLAPPYH